MIHAQNVLSDIKEHKKSKAKCKSTSHNQISQPRLYNMGLTSDACIMKTKCDTSLSIAKEDQDLEKLVSYGNVLEMCSL